VPRSEKRGGVTMVSSSERVPRPRDAPGSRP
jgi:hypothetical protein